MESSTPISVSMVHEQEGCLVAKQNGRVPGTFVSQDELNDLGKLLTTLRDYVVSHEARIELIEGWINEYHASHTAFPETSEEGVIDAAVEEAAEEARFEGEG